MLVCGWQAPPVDQYRKRIGRQDSKKEKRHLKEVKQRHEAKENRFTAYKDAVNQSLGWIYSINKKSLDIDKM